jgi:hypothetical protein
MRFRPILPVMAENNYSGRTLASMSILTKSFWSQRHHTQLHMGQYGGQDFPDTQQSAAVQESATHGHRFIAASFSAQERGAESDRVFLSARA